MSLNFKSSLAIAQRYIGVTVPLKRLGWGISGFIYLTPDLRTAIKVHSGDEGYATEIATYRILAKNKIIQLHGLTIPKMRKVNDQLRVIQMDFVSPPFLLDFAGTQFEEPDFEEHVWEHWHQQITDNYGRNAWIAYAVYESLRKFGIYYLDFRPSNMKLDGLPGLIDDAIEPMG